MLTLERPIVRTETARDEAFTRLIGVLEATGVTGFELPRLAGGVSPDRTGRLARLRLARAVYALKNNGGAERIGDGAWVFLNCRAA